MLNFSYNEINETLLHAILFLKVAPCMLSFNFSCNFVKLNSLHGKLEVEVLYLHGKSKDTTCNICIVYGGFMLYYYIVIILDFNYFL